MLGNIFSDRPFLLIEQANPDATQEKKVLIFADPLYNKRSLPEQKSIAERLTLLVEKRFQYFLSHCRSVERVENGMAATRKNDATFTKHPLLYDRTDPSFYS